MPDPEARGARVGALLRRALAATIDVAPVAYVVLRFLAAFAGAASAGAGLASISVALPVDDLLFGLGWVALVTVLSASRGVTPGLWLAGLRLVGPDGGPPGLARGVLLRCGVPLVVAALAAAVHPVVALVLLVVDVAPALAGRPALHDRVAGTASVPVAGPRPRGAP